MFYIGILHARDRGKSYFSMETMGFTRIATSVKTAIFTKTAILVISMEIIEICYFGVKRTMPGPGVCVIIDISLGISMFCDMLGSVSFSWNFLRNHDFHKNRDFR